MASGILGGGLLPQNTNTHAYTTPPGTTTTASLLLSGSAAGTVILYFGSASVSVTVPAGGIVTMAGIVLAAGQSVVIATFAADIRCLLTGWESAV